MRRAVIDVGTNTVKLLVADVTGHQVVPVHHHATATRLGEGVHHTRRLAPAAIARTLAALDRYLADARHHGATDVRALTTSATRGATNADDFLRAAPLPVTVISGEQEAELTFRGVNSDPAWADADLLVMDVGGGSAEWIRGRAGQVTRLRSLPVGAVRLQETFGDDFAGLAAHLRQVLAGELAPFRAGQWRMIGTGGSITTLAHIAGPVVDHATLTLPAIRELVTHLNALTLAQRRAVPGLPVDRADIIVPGGAVFLFAMEALGATELTVSVRALRYGALLT